MSVEDKKYAICNYCRHKILDNNLLEHLLLQHKNKYFKIIGNINYFNTFHSKNINETKYIIDKTLTDKLLDIYLNEPKTLIEDYLADIFMDNLYEYNNIKYIENNIFLVYYKNKWLIDVNNQYVKFIINNFIQEIKIIIENNMMKYKQEHIFILHAIIKILDFSFMYELLYDAIKHLKN